MNRRAALLLAAPLLLAACGDDPPLTVPRDATADADASDATAPPPDVPAPPPPRDIPYTEPPRTLVVEPGVRREVLLIDVPAAPPNPVTNAATPAEHNRVQVLRYRVDSPAPTPAQAVIVAVPGFLGGAGSFDPLARALVRRSAAAMRPVEVWALDRRSNLLEDLRGMDMAEAMHDPDIAAGYYIRQDVTVGGRAFAGFRGPADPALSYASEWGLATLVSDLRAVVARVPMSRQHVVLLGHSLGASVVEAYAAWDFAGTPGYRSVAGIAMLDGVASGSSLSEAEWRMGGGLGAGISNPGVANLRRSGPWFASLPVIGVRALALAEIVARRAAVAPDDVARDDDRDGLFRVLLSTPMVPPMTNAAAFGFAFDDGSCPLAFARMSMGAPGGGPLRGTPNPFSPEEMLSVPESATATYRWTDASRATPREFTPVATAAAAWAATPTNFSEWYFPTRLGIDVSALGDLSLPAESWQVREGLRVTHGREVDVPVLGVAAGLVGRAEAYERVRARVAPALGMDLPAAGAARSTLSAFVALHVPRMTHLDPVTAADGNPENPVPEVVLSFVTGATAGLVTAQ